MELRVIHPETRHHRWHLLRTAFERDRHGVLWVRCGWAPLQRTATDPIETGFELIELTVKLFLSSIHCRHQWECMSSNPEEPYMCVWCGKRSKREETVNRILRGTCYHCGRHGWNLREWTWDTGPGSGHTGHFCDKCWSSRPRNWGEIMGISRQMSPDATFVRYVGTPRITASEYGANAYGSVLAEHSDGNRTGVVCGHGGSAWLCLKCAEEMMK